MDHQTRCLEITSLWLYFENRIELIVKIRCGVIRRKLWSFRRGEWEGESKIIPVLKFEPHQLERQNDNWGGGVCEWVKSECMYVIWDWGFRSLVWGQLSWKYLFAIHLVAPNDVRMLYLALTPSPFVLTMSNCGKRRYGSGKGNGIRRHNQSSLSHHRRQVSH